MSEQDDLTTDAIPSPPRDEVKNEENSNVEHEQINTPKAKIRSKPSKKTKKTNTAFASVINISNANAIHIGSNYNVYLKEPNHNAQQEDYVVTDAIKALFESTEVVEREHLMFLSPHINKEWRSTARLLDFSDGQIDQFDADYSKAGMKEVIYHLLLDWTQNEADSATVGRLSKTLWNTSQQDAVIRWSKSFHKERLEHKRTDLRLLLYYNNKNGGIWIPEYIMKNCILLRLHH